MSDDAKLNRRDFFKRAAVIGASVTGASALVAACEPSGGSSASDESGSATAKQGGELNCNPDDLPESKKKVREALKYVDKSPKPDKDCKNCNLYEPPEKPGTCGGCTSVPGPIHPDGYCTAWVEKKG